MNRIIGRSEAELPSRDEDAAREPAGVGQHTPGPWLEPHFVRDDHQCNCQYVLAEPYMGAVATVHNAERDGDDYPGGEEARANARLIVAAPELLAAAEAMLRAYGNEAEEAAAFRLAEAAIAKAESR